MFKNNVNVQKQHLYLHLKKIQMLGMSFLFVIDADSEIAFSFKIGANIQSRCKYSETSFSLKINVNVRKQHSYLK